MIPAIVVKRGSLFLALYTSICLVVSRAKTAKLRLLSFLCNVCTHTHRLDMDPSLCHISSHIVDNRRPCPSPHTTHLVFFIFHNVSRPNAMHALTVQPQRRTFLNWMVSPNRKVKPIYLLSFVPFHLSLFTLTSRHIMWKTNISISSLSGSCLSLLTTILSSASLAAASFLVV